MAVRTITEKEASALLEQRILTDKDVKTLEIFQNILKEIGFVIVKIKNKTSKEKDLARLKNAADAAQAAFAQNKQRFIACKIPAEFDDILTEIGLIYLHPYETRTDTSKLEKNITTAIFNIELIKTVFKEIRQKQTISGINRLLNLGKKKAKTID